MRRVLSAVVVTLAATATAAVLLVAGPAGAAAPQRAVVKWNALHQRGQDIDWRVGLSGPLALDTFSLSGAKQLCLRLGQGSRTALGHEMCLTGSGAHPRTLRLIWARSTTSGLLKRKQIPASFQPVGADSLRVLFDPTLTGFKYERIHWQVRTTIHQPGASCGSTPGASCARLLPMRPTALALHTPKLTGCVATGPKWVFDKKTKVKEVALTFDDGPSPDPPAIDFVRRLHSLHAVATFFEIGDQISTFDPGGKAEKLMLKDGDMIGDHTWTHPDMETLGESQQRSEIELTKNAIRHATGGFTPCLFRAPYGATDPELLNLTRSLGFTTIQWDVDTQDWKLPGEQAIYEAAVDGAHPGAIILQHFGGGPRYETYDAIPAEIKTLRARGYKFVTVTQLLGYKLLYR